MYYRVKTIEQDADDVEILETKSSGVILPDETEEPILFGGDKKTPILLTGKSESLWQGPRHSVERSQHRLLLHETTLVSSTECYLLDGWLKNEDL